MRKPRRNRVVLRVSPGCLCAEAMRGTRAVWSGRFTWGDLDDLPRVLVELAATPELGRDLRALDVLVERPVAQLRRLTDLPPVRQATLRTLVQTQSTRYFRRNGVPLVTDAIWAHESGSRVARLCAVDVTLLEAIADGAGAAGLRLESVAPAEGAGLSLLPPSTRAARLARRKRSLARWALIAVGLWGFVGTSYLVRLGLESRRVEAELNRIEAPAAALRALRQEMRTARKMTEAVAATERSEHDLTRWLAAVTLALPDSAFITSLSLSALGRSSATGYAARAAEVAVGFERAAGIREPRLEGHPAREVLLGREWDRFTVAFGDSMKPGRRLGN